MKIRKAHCIHPTAWSVGGPGPPYPSTKNMHMKHDKYSCRGVRLTAAGDPRGEHNDVSREFEQLFQDMCVSFQQSALLCWSLPMVHHTNANKEINRRELNRLNEHMKETQIHKVCFVVCAA